MRAGSTPKQSWQGRGVAIQPRIRLPRSFDERTHTYLGYAVRLDGTIGERRGGFLAGVGPGERADRGDSQLVQRRERGVEVVHIGDPGLDEILDSPYVLVGMVDQLVEDLQSCRERWGRSYYPVQEPVMDALAPVVARRGIPPAPDVPCGFLRPADFL